jgi:hypothetical protein
VTPKPPVLEYERPADEGSESSQKVPVIIFLVGIGLLVLAGMAMVVVTVFGAL